MCTYVHNVELTNLYMLESVTDRTCTYGRVACLHHHDSYSTHLPPHSFPLCIFVNVGEEVVELEHLEGQMRTLMDKFKHQRRELKQTKDDTKVCSGGWGGVECR